MSKQCKILIGEDDLEDQLILQEYFLENGVQDVVAFEKNGKKILEFLNNIEDKNQLPQLIVLDLNMPIQNGTQTLFEIKQQSRYSHIPVIIYSTSNNDHEKRKCLNFGAVDYLVKPITVDEGNIMIQKFLAFVR